MGIKWLLELDGCFIWICDIIISQNPISIVKYAPALKIIIEKELELVNQL